jgi:hypothetical protein
MGGKKIGGLREKEQEAKCTFIMCKDTNIEMEFSIFSLKFHIMFYMWIMKRETANAVLRHVLIISGFL